MGSKQEIEREIGNIERLCVHLRTQLTLEQMDGIEYWRILGALEERLFFLKQLHPEGDKQAVESPEMREMTKCAEKFFAENEKMFEEARRYTLDGV